MNAVSNMRMDIGGLDLGEGMEPNGLKIQKILETMNVGISNLQYSNDD